MTTVAGDPPPSDRRNTDLLSDLLLLVELVRRNPGIRATVAPSLYLEAPKDVLVSYAVATGQDVYRTRAGDGWVNLSVRIRTEAFFTSLHCMDRDETSFGVDRLDATIMQEERDAAELAEEQAADERGPHGIPMREATSPLADPNDRLHGWHYETRVRIDHAQRALNLAQEERRKKYPDEDHGSLLWSLVRVEDGPPER